MKKLGKKGFTFVELLIVMVIISVLAITAIAGYQGYKKRAIAAQIATDARTEMIESSIPD